MIKCPFCQFENEDGALFCEQCKLDLGTVEPAAEHSADGSAPLTFAQTSAAPDAAVAEAAGPLSAVAVAEAAMAEAVPVAQVDAGVAAAAEVPIAVAVPFPETSPLTVAPESPSDGVLVEAAPVSAQPDSGSANVEPAPVEPAAPTTPDTLSPMAAAQQETTAPPGTPDTHGRLPSGAKPKLVVLRGQRVNAEYPLYEGDNYVGRADEKAVDIDLEDQEPPDRIWSSRQHALITYDDGLLTIEDLNSTNGTFLNRLRVHPGQKRPLQVNDVIQIGNVQMKVEI